MNKIENVKGAPLTNYDLYLTLKAIDGIGVATSIEDITISAYRGTRIDKQYLSCNRRQEKAFIYRNTAKAIYYGIDHFNRAENYRIK